MFVCGLTNLCIKLLGSAWLVLHKQENAKYVAKKVLLDGLPPKEQNNCRMEAGLLKNLVHPNIVNYKESFLGDDALVIIMEYCEGKHIFFLRNSITGLLFLVGDLAYHIKRKVQKGETFTEEEIFHWFIQITMALEYVHGRRVIHRDIKT